MKEVFQGHAELGVDLLLLIFGLVLCLVLSLALLLRTGKRNESVKLASAFLNCTVQQVQIGLTSYCVSYCVSYFVWHCSSYSVSYLVSHCCSYEVSYFVSHCCS